MTTWALIIILNPFWSSGVAVTNVTGFTSESSCIVAGNKLLKGKKISVEAYECVEVK